MCATERSGCWTQGSFLGSGKVWQLEERSVHVEPSLPPSGPPTEGKEGLKEQDA